MKGCGLKEGLDETDGAEEGGVKDEACGALGAKSIGLRELKLFGELLGGPVNVTVLRPP